MDEKPIRFSGEGIRVNIYGLPAVNVEGVAQQLAYQQGCRDADVDARLLDHERRLRRLEAASERARSETVLGEN